MVISTNLVLKAGWVWCFCYPGIKACLVSTAQVGSLRPSHVHLCEPELAAAVFEVCVSTARKVYKAAQASRWGIRRRALGLLESEAQRP